MSLLYFKLLWYKYYIIKKSLIKFHHQYFLKALFTFFISTRIKKIDLEFCVNQRCTLLRVLLHLYVTLKTII